MIVFDLKCGKDHVFEAWFKDSATYESQADSGRVPCPECGDTEISKSLMAPRLNTGSGGRNSPKQAAEQHAMVSQALKEMRRQVEENCDYVGKKFPEEARKIHYGETDARNIYGEASPKEAKALHDEGVEVQPVPWVPREDA